ncbi:MAG: hypothetical protein ACXACC_00905 [Promethearchaeota archaeon]|jgi:hypothetical protein
MKVEIINKPEEIVEFLQLGINLPILPKFHKYILKAFEIFKPNAILIRNERRKDKLSKSLISDVLGICLVFRHEEILLFGFFGAYNDETNIIELLIKNLLKYARTNNYKYIRGPINIPAIIYGYGFSVKTTFKEIGVNINDFFIACPISQPIYYQIFLKKGFYEKYTEDFYYMPVIKLNPLKLKYDYSDYEVLFPGKKNIWSYMNEVLKLHIKNMPKESLITPNSPQYANIIVDFIYDFGKPWMIWLVRHKPTHKIVGTAHIVPNVFGERDSKGRYKTASFQHVVVDKEHQRRGLLIFLYGMGSLKATDKKSGNNLKYGLGIVASNNKPSIAWITKLGGQLFKRSIILECKL